MTSRHRVYSLVIYCTIPLGKAKVKREGSDVTIVAIGEQVHTALEAAEQLTKKRFEVEVIDPPCIYTAPEIASVGLTEKAARDQYGDIFVGELPFTANFEKENV